MAVVSPGCWTFTNSVSPSGARYGPVSSASTGPLAKRNATPRFGPDVGIMNIALFAWYW